MPGSDGQPVLLLVEDSAADREIIRRALTGVSVSPAVELSTCHDGESALQYLTATLEKGTLGPDLILLDLNLPDVSGRELLEKIRHNDRLRHIPVVVLTTSHAPQDILDCYRLGANCFLTKPAAFQHFVEMLHLTCRFWFQHVALPSLPAAGSQTRAV